jgi:hypothetical protein
MRETPPTAVGSNPPAWNQAARGLGALRAYYQARSEALVLGLERRPWLDRTGRGFFAGTCVALGAIFLIQPTLLAAAAVSFVVEHGAEAMRAWPRLPWASALVWSLLGVALFVNAGGFGWGTRHTRAITIGIIAGAAFAYAPAAVLAVETTTWNLPSLPPIFLVTFLLAQVCLCALSVWIAHNANRPSFSRLWLLRPPSWMQADPPNNAGPPASLPPVGNPPSTVASWWRAHRGYVIATMLAGAAGNVLAAIIVR